MSKTFFTANVQTVLKLCDNTLFMGALCSYADMTER